MITLPEHLENSFLHIAEIEHKPVSQVIEQALMEFLADYLPATPSKSVTKNAFEDLCGVLTAERGVSDEEMEQVIAQQAQERFNDCN